ncbi:hypothetical protein DTO013E5_4200 [Penicillium roqueforti]|uniref:Genomic scaffold, ProqFM164S01 n=1 Tax=Penicillium roqueforti (strain FM164) TaxID=1365484 RepID=W6QBD8_PENRF|nr:uncharacterized protein LCP9604111_4186 [Penicillium roqueforti]CDM27007.1 unnamed protein product [Penicillium roqueforti FM164]KAF9249557.1 hypothetical protein LCP9604111_4186 [Penicillium roqueforti]KAI1835098.1 hypothetical protein CBS147337_3915 [Penicillium roqueforti]KAI2677111.1 hypothetical protein CBS147355_5338 [Penicillium roqueforti]KAI2688591.1 hypothetical protein LCP963914a_2993 [Penicillium roqueforti]
MTSVTCLALQPSLSISKCESTVTELKGCDSPKSPSEMAKVKRIDPPGNELGRQESRASTSTSISHSRSASRSTVRSRPNSRRSSLHSRRAVPNAAIVPVTSARSSMQDKRESLIALHRESCRLFQDESNRPSTETRLSLYRTASATYRPQRESRISTEKGSSEPSSPVRHSYSSIRFGIESTSPTSTSAPHFITPRDRSNTLPSSHHRSPSSSSIHVPATVMEWTSPDTRRREYEKIDRASSGVRGLWRRVAPRCFQSRDSRTPFFEEGKTEREGSVRRFRMDIPEDEEPESDSQGNPQAQLLELLGKTSLNSNSPDGARRRWTCLRSKSSPLPNA